MTYEEAVADAYCPCHGEPWYVQPGGKHAGVRSCPVKLRLSRARRNARYRSSEKGKAANARYEKSEKRRATKARYKKSEQGRASSARVNARRVFMGATFLGMAPTAEHAAELNQMGRDFAAQQKGAA